MLIRTWRTQVVPWRQLWRLQSTSATSATTISPILLSRARALAAEHNQLAERLDKEYDNQTAKRAGSLAPVATAFSSWEAASSVGAPLRPVIDQSLNLFFTESLRASKHTRRSKVRSRTPKIGKGRAQSYLERARGARQSVTDSSHPRAPLFITSMPHRDTTRRRRRRSCAVRGRSSPYVHSILQSPKDT